MRIKDFIKLFWSWITLREAQCGDKVVFLIHKKRRSKYDHPEVDVKYNAYYGFTGIMHCENEVFWIQGDTATLIVSPYFRWYCLKIK